MSFSKLESILRSSNFMKKVIYFNKGLSLVELLVAFVVFVLLFVSAIRNYTESNLPMQSMIRDYAIAMNLGGKLLCQAEDYIKNGEETSLIGSDKDITLDLLNNFEFQNYLERFAGGIKDTVNFQVTRSIIKEPESDIFHVSFNFVWKDKTMHRFSIQSSFVRDVIISSRQIQVPKNE